MTTAQKQDTRQPDHSAKEFSFSKSEVRDVQFNFKYPNYFASAHDSGLVEVLLHLLLLLLLLHHLLTFTGIFNTR